ncbi:MAG: D-glycero-beta-D-manno-heptose 1,7-bisphosphate 7-phosphatase [Planctomycetota bacterium]|jgi:D-glycero-D-manno-heptose 1,7-bisphosphate phosphatase|nr:D-glycero-beta-D-manno-heptose 1,7-bisphosphate 7-phosphatase [Planctomycetota bacterium]
MTIEEIADPPLRLPAVFLDRDGVLNVEKGYLHRWEDWEWIPGAPPALAELSRAGFKLVVATNQAGVAKGYYGEDAVRRLHDRVNRDLRERTGTLIDAFYHCPHHPDFGPPCACRKPRPGLLLRAAEELGLDLPASWMVGDKLSDLEAGRAASCRPLLVRTGYGAETEAGIPGGIGVFADLPAAARFLVGIRERGR